MRGPSRKYSSSGLLCRMVSSDIWSDAASCRFKATKGAVLKPPGDNWVLPGHHFAIYRQSGDLATASILKSVEDQSTMANENVSPNSHLGKPSQEWIEVNTSLQLADLVLTPIFYSFTASNPTASQNS